MSDPSPYARYKLAKRYGRRCFYCREPFANIKAATLDHYIPRSLWRTNRMSNLVLACGPCNWRKGAALPWPLVWLLLAHADAIRALDYQPAALAA